jgi:hypothetical protein
MSEEQQQIPIYDSQEPSEESKQLVALFHDLESRQLDFLDDAAKSIVERVATFLAILFGVTAFGSAFPPPYLKDNAAAKTFVIITLVLYLVALGAGMWAIQPRYYRRYTYNASMLAKELEKITKRKMFWLRFAGILFAVGSLALAALVVAIIWHA